MGKTAGARLTYAQGERHWPALDGLRGFAVIAVMLFHAGVPHADLGFTGVDVFFVLSGFLITTRLLDDVHQNGRIQFGAFYMRRFLRLYPCLFVVMALSVLFAYAVHTRFLEVAKGALAALLYVSNIWIYSRHETAVLQHTWTLALEEQFYLLWPLLLAFVLTRRHRLRWALLTMFAIAGAVAIAFHVTSGPTANVFSSYIRASGLPLGCLVALLLAGGHEPRTRWQRLGTLVLCAASLVALVAIAFVIGNWLSMWIFVRGISPAAVLTVPVIYGLVTVPPRFVEALLASRPLVWMGKRSYGLYLWHFMVFLVAVHHAPSGSAFFVRVAAAMLVSIAIAGLSYRYLESPFLRLKRRFAAHDTRSHAIPAPLQPSLASAGAP